MADVSSGLRAGPATYAGLFVVTLTTLMYEIVLTRIFSVTMWYHFAFVAISVALFGMTVGALLVHLRPEWFTEHRVKRQMARFSLLFALSIALAFVMQLAVPFVPEANVAGVWSIVYTCVVISVPFVCSGVVVCLALTRFPRRVNRLYAVDLVGAGLGCVLLVAAFEVFDGPSLVIAIAAVAAGGALLFAAAAGDRGGKLLGAVAMVGLAALAVGNGYLHSQGRPLVKILWAKEQRDTPHRYDEWNAFSRVTVDGNPDGEPFLPPGYSLSTEMPADLRVRSLSAVIDSTAGTWFTGYTGDPDETDYLRYDITNLAYYAKEGADFDRAAVVGVGGGRDVLAALEFGVGQVTGIEINGNILDLLNDTLGDYTGHLDQNPRVDLVNDEARSYLTRTDGRYDTIQISLIDTWAATSAGAFALSENSLYTTDAWHTYFDRLQPGGILSVSRWFRHENGDPLETFRTTALAAQVLHERGVENPRDHILIYEGPPGRFGQNVATVLVSPEAFDDDTIARIDAAAEALAFPAVLTPDVATDERFVRLTAPGGPGPAIQSFTADISAPTDDRPFFFQMADLGTIVDVLFRGEGVGSGLVFKPVWTLASLGLAVLLLAALCIGGPLVHMSRRTSHRGNAPYYLFFAGIGLGFMFVEISQLQRLSTFLGHPTYALTVVLFTVLLFSGLGSMLVEKVTDANRPATLLAPLAVLLAAVVVFGVTTPGVIDDMASRTTPVRIATAVGLLAPLALLMGMPFSIGMRAASRDRGTPTAFLWGINGAMSVLASVFATVCSLLLGIPWTFFFGALPYAVAALSLWFIVRRLRGPADEGEATVAEPEPRAEALVPVAGGG